MLDAVRESIARLRQRPNSRRVLLLISESRDRGSESTLDRVAVAAQTAGVTVYAATYSAFKTAFTSRSPAGDEPRAPKSPKTPWRSGRHVERRPTHLQSLPPAEQRVDILAASENSRGSARSTTRRR